MTKLKIKMDSFDDLEQARENILSFCTNHCGDSKEVDVLEMAILEACHNALRYGSKRKNQSLCRLNLFFDNQTIKAVVKNYGKAYHVAEKETFSLEQDFLQYKNGGLGIPLIKSLVDSVEYLRKSNNLNELTLIKKILTKQ